MIKRLTVNYANPAQPASSLDFDWRNTWYVAVGADYYLNDKVTLRGGVALDLTPTYVCHPRCARARLHPQIASFGMAYKASEHFELNASYAHVFVNAAHINDSISATGDALTGEFDDYGNLLSFSAQYKF